MEYSWHTRYTSIVKRMTKVAPWPKGAPSVPLLQSHRGYRALGAQENTMEAFMASASHGYKMIELDVQLSKDRIPVVFHDDVIARFAAGSDARVEELTARELKEKVNAPSLREVLLNKAMPENINIEFKTRKKVDEALERKVYEVLCETETCQRVIVSSFNPLSLWRFSLYTEEIPMALIVADKMEQKYLQEMWLTPFLKIHLLHLEAQKLNPISELLKWKEYGVPVSVWTVNDQSVADKMLEHGALSIITDTLLPNK